MRPRKWKFDKSGMLMPGSDRYFLELSDVVLLKVETKGVIVLKLYFKYYYSSIVSFILFRETAYF